MKVKETIKGYDPIDYWLGPGNEDRIKINAYSYRHTSDPPHIIFIVSPNQGFIGWHRATRLCKKCNKFFKLEHYNQHLHK